MLQCKNIIVNKRRTSMRLDKETWLALSDICKREGLTLSGLCSLIDSNKGMSGLSGATRVFALAYFRRSLSKYEVVDLPAVSPRVEEVLSFVMN